MAIPLIGSSDALFPRLGRIGKVALLSATCQSDIVTQLDDLLGRYPAAEEFLTGSLAVNRDTLTRGVASGLLSSLRSLAQATLTEMVRQDQPARVSDPIGELIRQMLLSVDSVPACAVTVAVVVDGTNTGDNLAVVTAKRGDGRNQENMVAEVGRLVVTTDSRTGSAAAGAEAVKYTGVANPAGSWDWDYPRGSGASRTFGSADAVTGRASLLRNGGWDAWTSGVPTYWTKTGTLAQESTTVFGSGASSVKVLAGGTASLTQHFASATTGASARLNPLASLSFAMRIRGSAALSTGTIAVALVDGAGTILDDDQGVSQSMSFNLNTVTTSWVAITGTLRTPRVMPDDYAVRVTITTPTGGNLFADHFAAVPPTALYTGGPGVAVFGGATAAVSGDGWTVTTTNDRAGVASGLTWQSLFARLFGDGLILPSSGAPTVANSLISS